MGWDGMGDTHHCIFPSPLSFFFRTMCLYAYISFPSYSFCYLNGSRDDEGDIDIVPMMDSGLGTCNSTGLTLP
jgi:hypothetical protein